jgi:hypothetical protein
LAPVRPHGSPIVSVVNASTLVSDQEVAAVAAALNIQVDRDWFPVWGSRCYLKPVPKGQAPAAGTWWLVVADDSDTAGALGYHDLTNEGYPLGKAFVRTAQRYNQDWAVTASHEILEMIADPYVYTLAGPDSQNRIYALEVCDAVENDVYAIHGVNVSDFVYPAWFGNGPMDLGLDHLKLLTSPFQLRPGGYISVLVNNRWGELLGDKSPSTAAQSRAPVGSRRERRRVGEDRWLVSDAPP